MNFKKNKLKTIYFLVVILGTVWFVTYFVRNIHIDQDTLVINKDAPTEYLSIVDIKDTSELKPKINYVTKYRAPITLLNYKNRYSLIFYKICNNIEVPITQFININYDYSLYNSSQTYSVVKEKYFELNFLDDTTGKITKLKLNLVGDSISNLIKSDTLLLYNLKFSQISWFVNSNKFFDINIELRNITPFSKKIPASIAFLKRDNSLFFILLSVNDDGSYFDKNMLMNLLFPVSK